ncbi:MAG: epoxyqueuosine reductase [Dehalococcoidales bacterium]|nr:epoxyqueuosine reductase [Dehalococcoidales bacterium]
MFKLYYRPEEYVRSLSNVRCQYRIMSSGNEITIFFKQGEMVKIEQSIKEHARRIGMDLCGIAPVSRFDGAPQGTHPCDFLPGCKSVISIAVRLADGVIQTIFRRFEDGNRPAQGVYGTYGYTIAPNFHLLYSVYDLTQYIERNTGAIAMPTQVGPLQTGITLSQRHAAVAAGLGEFGWLSIVLTPQFGPRNRFGAILTTAELEPDPMYSGPRLCDPSKCNICTTVCPTGALSKYGEREARRVVYKDKDGEKVYDYCHVNMNRCRIAAHALMKKTGGREDLLTSLDATAEEVSAAVKKTGSEGTLQDSPTWKCGKCLAYCPSGNWKQKFKDTGLSKQLPIVEW